ncbi:MAG TPA: extracellular solute-binding protein [Candidatus Binatia bacterium]
MAFLTDRRNFLFMTGLAALAAIAVVLGAAFSAGAQGNWEQVLAAARKEGKVSVSGPPGDIYRIALNDAFQKKYPDIIVEWDGSSGREKMPKIVRERKSGLFNWDLYIGGSGSPLRVLKPLNAFDPLRPEVILPDNLEDSKWIGGFDAGFVDAEGTLIYAFDGTRQDVIYVNRDFIPASEFSAFKQLPDPKFAGKIVWEDPRREGSGLNSGLLFMLTFGEDFLKELLSKQKIVYTRDRRQLTEWVVRGRYPIGISFPEDIFKPFKEKGLGKNVVPLEDESLVKSYSQGFGSVAVFNRRPHPNATKVYLNWLLSREGQTSWVTNSFGRNSRRADAPVGDAKNALTSNEKFFNTQSEPYIPKRRLVMKIASELIAEK